MPNSEFNTGEFGQILFNGLPGFGGAAAVSTTVATAGTAAEKFVGSVAARSGTASSAASLQKFTGSAAVAAKSASSSAALEKFLANCAGRTTSATSATARIPTAGAIAVSNIVKTSATAVNGAVGTKAGFNTGEFGQILYGPNIAALLSGTGAVASSSRISLAAIERFTGAVSVTALGGAAHGTALLALIGNATVSVHANSAGVGPASSVGASASAARTAGIAVERFRGSAAAASKSATSLAGVERFQGSDAARSTARTSSAGVERFLAAGTARTTGAAHATGSAALVGQAALTVPGAAVLAFGPVVGFAGSIAVKSKLSSSLTALERFLGTAQLTSFPRVAASALGQFVVLFGALRVQARSAATGLELFASSAAARSTIHVSSQAVQIFRSAASSSSKASTLGSSFQHGAAVALAVSPAVQAVGFLIYVAPENVFRVQPEHRKFFVARECR